MILHEVSFRIYSKIFSIKQIEQIIGIKCDEKKEIGDIRVANKKCLLKFDENVWILKSSVENSRPISFHLIDLINRVKSKTREFSQLKNCDVMFECIINGDEGDGMPEINIPNKIIIDIATLNASLDIDLYLN